MAPKVFKAAKTNAKAKPKPARGLKLFLEANDNVGEWVPITVANDMTAGEWLEVRMGWLAAWVSEWVDGVAARLGGGLVGWLAAWVIEWVDGMGGW